MKSTACLRDEVELLGVQRRDDAVPVGGHHLALGLHLGAQRLADVEVEADRLAAGIDAVEGRVGAFGADAQLVGGAGVEGEGQGCSGGQQDLLIVLHAVLLR